MKGLHANDVQEIFMNSPLITGSLAFDYIMQIGGRFADRLATPEAGFSAAYIAPQLRRLFGGCAGNIAFGLRQLGDTPQIMATVGEDFSPYRQYLQDNNIDDAHVKTLPGFFTAQAYIVGDDDHSQIIIFHPGATAEAHQQSISDLPEPPPLAIVSPNGLGGMLRFGRDCAAAKTPFIFDPGQAIGMFAGAELKEMMSLCRVAIFNQDEYTAMQNITGDSSPMGDNQALIITRGAEGSELFMGDKNIKVAAANFGETADSTGCGDAYRAGLIYGMMRDWQWQQSMQFASVIAGVKALHNGGQGYTISASEVNEKCKKVFG